MWNILWNSLEILAIAWGGPTMILGFMRLVACRASKDKKEAQKGMVQVLIGTAAVTAGLATPGDVNWLPADGSTGICQLVTPSDQYYI
jgi:hypothetical protein